MLQVLTPVLPPTGRIAAKGQDCRLRVALPPSSLLTSCTSHLQQRRRSNFSSGNRGRRRAEGLVVTGRLLPPAAHRLVTGAALGPSALYFWALAACRVVRGTRRIDIATHLTGEGLDRLLLSAVFPERDLQLPLPFLQLQ